MRLPQRRARINTDEAFQSSRGWYVKYVHDHMGRLIIRATSPAGIPLDCATPYVGFEGVFRDQLRTRREFVHPSKLAGLEAVDEFVVFLATENGLI